LFTISSGILSDKLIQAGRLSRAIVRKIFNSVGFIVPMIAVIGLIFITSDKAYYGVLLVTIGLAFSGLTYGGGFLVNYNDIGGTFAGIVFGLSNTIGTISGIVAPYLVGELTPNVNISSSIIKT
jgi:ACS family sodium-dependent inorganic phosphate cotransporter-like MFS transporter 5